MEDIVYKLLNPNFDTQESKNKYLANAVAFALMVAGEKEDTIVNVVTNYKFKDNIGGVCTADGVILNEEIFLDKKLLGRDLLCLWHEVGHLLDMKKANRENRRFIDECWTPTDEFIRNFVNKCRFYDKDIHGENERQEMYNTLKDYYYARYYLRDIEVSARNFSKKVASKFMMIANKKFCDECNFESIKENFFNEIVVDLMNTRYNKKMLKYEGCIKSYSRILLGKYLDRDKNGKNIFERNEKYNQNNMNSYNFMMKSLSAVLLACLEVRNEEYLREFINVTRVLTEKLKKDEYGTFLYPKALSFQKIVFLSLPLKMTYEDYCYFENNPAELTLNDMEKERKLRFNIEDSIQYYQGARC